MASPHVHRSGLNRRGEASQARFGDGGTARGSRRFQLDPLAQRRELLDTSTELQVLKCILLREGYVSQLRRMVDVLSGAPQQPTLPTGMVDALDLLRQATLDTVEAIATWRLAMRHPESHPFLWNGQNYLSKVSQDLDFLDSFAPLRDWFGFSLARNPFLAPPQWDQQGGKVDPSGLFIELGKKPWQRALEVEIAPEKVSRKRQRPTKATPYGTAVLNDPALLPSFSAKAPPSPHTLDKLLEPGGLRSTKRLSLVGITPNTLSRSDLTRVQSAQQLLGDEAAQQQHVQSGGHLSAAKVPQAILAVSGVLSSSVVAAAAAAAAAPVPQSDDSCDPIPRGPSAGFGEEGADPVVKKKLVKVGADMHALTAAGTVGRKQAPRRQNRYARLRRELERHEEDVQMLRGEVDELRSISPRPEGVLLRLEQKERELAFRQADVAGKQIYFVHLNRAQELADGRHVYLEQRRRALQEGEILPEDEAVAMSVEDVFAARIQAIVRRNRDMRFVEWYRSIVHHAATVIQAGIRGHWSRVRLHRWARLDRAATIIEASFRMYLQRCRYLRLRQQSRETYAARVMQRVSRAYMGRTRAKYRHSMISAARRASAVVAVGRLQPYHLKELAAGIRAGIIDHGASLPPAAVLSLLRCVLTYFGEGEETITFYTAMGAKVTGKVHPATMSWEMAMRVLRRPRKLLRRLRALSSGLCNRLDDITNCPPRLLSLSDEAICFMRAHDGHPHWEAPTLSSMRGGAKAARCLITYVRELAGVLRGQEVLGDFIKDSQPAWLRTSRRFQRRKRWILLQIALCTVAVEQAEQSVAALKKSGKAFGEPLQACTVLKVKLDREEQRLRDLGQERCSFEAKHRRLKKEGEGLWEQKMVAGTREVQVVEKEIEMAQSLAENGHQDNLPRAKEKQRMRLQRLERNLQDLKIGLSEDKRLRAEWDRRVTDFKEPMLREWLPPLESHLLLARRAGSAQGMAALFASRKEHCLKQAGGIREISRLSEHALERLRVAGEKTNMFEEEACVWKAQLHSAVQAFESKVADEYERDAAAAIEMGKTQWDDATPESAEHEHAEDQAAAEEEVELMMGASIPPSFYTGGPNFPQRPFLLVLSTGLAPQLRQDTLARLECEMPGLFSHVDCAVGGFSVLERKAQGGPGADFAAIREIESAFASQHFVVLEIDTGMSLWSRGIFTRFLNAIAEAVFPVKPKVVVLSADMCNRAASGANLGLGVDPTGVPYLQDGPATTRMQMAAEAVYGLLQVWTTSSGEDKGFPLLGLVSLLGKESIQLLLVAAALLMGHACTADMTLEDLQREKVASAFLQEAQAWPGLEVVQQLRGVDASDASMGTVLLLQRVASEAAWPMAPQSAFAGEEGLWVHWGAWVVHSVEACILLSSKGGGGGSYSLEAAASPAAKEREQAAALQASLAQEHIAVIDDSWKVLGAQLPRGGGKWSYAADLFSTIATFTLEPYRVYHDADSQTIVSQACGNVYLERGQSIARVPHDQVLPTIANNCMERYDLTGGRVELREREDVFKALVSRLYVRDEDGTLQCGHIPRTVIQTSYLVQGKLVQVAISEVGSCEFFCEASAIKKVQSRGGEAAAVSVPLEKVGFLVSKRALLSLIPADDPILACATVDGPEVVILAQRIADHLRLSGTDIFGGPSPMYRHWAYYGGGQRVGGKQQQRQGGQSRQRLTLSLRKRAKGQTIFRRALSFKSPQLSLIPTGDGAGGEDPGEEQQPQQRREQRLVTMKQFAHRGSGGDLEVSAYDPTSGLTTPPVQVEGRAILSNVDLAESGGDSLAQETLWRLTLERGEDGKDALNVDMRKPLIALPRVAVQPAALATAAAAGGAGAAGGMAAISHPALSTHFRLFFLEKTVPGRVLPLLQLVAQSLRMGNTYSFVFPAKHLLRVVWADATALQQSFTSIADIRVRLGSIIAQFLSYSADADTLNLNIPGRVSICAPAEISLVTGGRKRKPLPKAGSLRSWVQDAPATTNSSRITSLGALNAMMAAYKQCLEGDQAGRKSTTAGSQQAETFTNTRNERLVLKDHVALKWARGAAADADVEEVQVYCTPVVVKAYEVFSAGTAAPAKRSFRWVVTEEEASAADPRNPREAELWMDDFTPLDAYTDAFEIVQTRRLARSIQLVPHVPGAVPSRGTPFALVVP